MATTVTVKHDGPGGNDVLVKYVNPKTGVPSSEVRLTSASEVKQFTLHDGQSVLISETEKVPTVAVSVKVPTPIQESYPNAPTSISAMAGDVKPVAGTEAADIAKSKPPTAAEVKAKEEAAAAERVRVQKLEADAARAKAETQAAHEAAALRAKLAKG